jgi:hypothetical protein
VLARAMEPEAESGSTAHESPGCEHLSLPKSKKRARRALNSLGNYNASAEGAI